MQSQSERTPHPIEFDIPINEFSFTGCPVKAVVKIRPTKYCLIAISEFPFFVIDLKDIEEVHFERVQFGIKNFDMAIIYKDFHTFKRINSIPRESIDQIKQYLNEIGIIFSEGTLPMNWNAVLAQIRENFDDFLADGGWKFLQDDEHEEGEEEDSELEGDPGFSEGMDEESEFSESSDFSGDGADYSSEVDDEVSEAMSWDEMEKKAYEEDKNAA